MNEYRTHDSTSAIDDPLPEPERPFASILICRSAEAQMGPAQFGRFMDWVKQEAAGQ